MLLDLWVSWWQLIFSSCHWLIHTSKPVIHQIHSYGFKCRTPFGIRHSCIPTSKRKNVPLGGIKGGFIHSLSGACWAALVADSAGLVWEFGQTCEAAGNGIKSIFFFTVLLIHDHSPPSIRKLLPSDPTNQNVPYQPPTFLFPSPARLNVHPGQRSYLIKEWI